MSVENLARLIKRAREISSQDKTAASSCGGGTPKKKEKKPVKKAEEEPKPEPERFTLAEAHQIFKAAEAQMVAEDAAKKAEHIAAAVELLRNGEAETKSE